MRKLHALGRDAGLSHEQLREVAGVESLKLATTQQLKDACAQLEVASYYVDRFGTAGDLDELRHAWRDLKGAHQAQPLAGIVYEALASRKDERKAQLGAA